MAMHQMQSEIMQIRDKLALHFLQEEDGGYLEEAIGRLPSVARPAATLQREHGELLALIDAIVADARPIADPQPAWKYLAQEFERFCKCLLSHETAENALRSRAFNVDLSTEA